MNKRIKWLFLASLLTVTAAAFLADFHEPSYGQRRLPPPNRKPACTIFCGSSPGYFYLFPREYAKAGKCWGGPLPADQAGNYYNELSEDDKKSLCQHLKSADKSTSSCPAFKTLMQFCNNESSEDKKCDQPKSPWLGSPSTDCKDFQGWQVEQTGGTVTLYICGYNVYSNPTVGTDKLFSSAYIGALKEALQNSIGEKLCCDAFREAARTGIPCDPRKDVDCDGTPNSADVDGNFPKIDMSYTTAEGAKVDPFPFGMEIGEIYPNQSSCKDCQWELMRGELKCSPDGREKHVYQAKWKCPSTGVEADTFKYAPATAPCKK